MEILLTCPKCRDQNLLETINKRYICESCGHDFAIKPVVFNSSQENLLRKEISIDHKILIIRKKRIRS